MLHKHISLSAASTLFGALSTSLWQWLATQNADKVLFAAVLSTAASFLTGRLMQWIFPPKNPRSKNGKA